MKLTGCTTYSKILYLLCSGPLMERAISNIKFSVPRFGEEGVAGAVLVDYELEVLDLKTLSNIFEGYCSLTDLRKLYLDGLSRGLGDLK